MIKSSCVISEFTFNLIVITFLYANMYIVYNFYKCFNSLIMLPIPKSFFHCLFIIKYDFTSSLISKILIFKRFYFVSTNIFSTVSFFKLNLHFVFKKPLIFLINAVIIMFILFLSINAIIFFFSTNTFIIAIIMFSIKYNAHNNFDLLIISIDFLYLKYQFDKFLFNLYIRYSSL